MTTYLGIQTDSWLIILTAIVVVETLVLIFLTIKLLRREKREIDPNALVKLVEKTLEKIPAALDAKQPPAISSKEFAELEERINLISQRGTRLNTGLLVKLGNVEYTQGNLSKALAYFKEALEHAKSSGDPITTGICLNNIGLVYADKGDADTALKYLEDALTILTEFKLVYGKDIILDAIEGLRMRGEKAE